MTDQRSRAYKLQLSDQGIHLFLRCHCRLCHLIGDFLPYGTTLLVALAALDRCADGDLPGLFLDPEIDRLGGDRIRFVGTSAILSNLVAAIGERLAVAPVPRPPQVWKIYLAALMHMEAMESRSLIHRCKELSVAARRGPGKRGK